MSILGALLVAVLIGAILPLQGLVNARLGVHVGGPVAAAFVSFLVGTVMLGLYLLATRTPIALQGSLRLPAWIWAGGVFGAIYVACFTLLLPRIGAAGMIRLAVLGQVTASLFLDHYGVLQAPKPVDWLRILGALLVLAGVWLVVAPWRAPAKAAAAQAMPEPTRCFIVSTVDRKSLGFNPSTT
jgi:transporter family-2 protein